MKFLKKLKKYANPYKAVRKGMKSKKFKTASRKIHGRLEQVGGYAIMAAGTVFGGVAGAAVGTAIAAPLENRAGRQLARSRGHGGRTARKAGRKTMKQGLIVGGILTGGAAIGAAAGVGGLTTGVLSSGGASAAGAGAGAGAAAATTGTAAAAAGGGGSSLGLIGAALTTIGTVASKVIGGGGKVGGGTYDAGGGPGLNESGAPGGGGLLSGLGLDPSTEDGKQKILVVAAVAAAVLIVFTK